MTVSPMSSREAPGGQLPGDTAAQHRLVQARVQVGLPRRRIVVNR
jgi:hypothetical protein